MKSKNLLLLLAVCILPVVYAREWFSLRHVGAGKKTLSGLDVTGALSRKEEQPIWTVISLIRKGAADTEVTAAMPVNWRGWISSCAPSFADTLIYVRQITLTGYCSIEGSYAANEKLAHDRANGFRNYLDTEYGLARRFPVEVRYVGEDWDRLRQLVEASTLPGRAEVLAVIDNTDIFKGP